jgi:hypothetical protein
MGHISAKPPRPFEPVTLADGGPWLVSTAVDGWIEAAIDLLLERESVAIDGIRVDGRDFDRKRPVWAQLRAILRRHGIRTPRQVSPSTLDARRSA